MKLSPHLNDLPSLAIRRPILIVVLNLLIIIAGYAALKGVEVRELPDVDRPIGRYAHGCLWRGGG